LVDSRESVRAPGAGFVRLALLALAFLMALLPTWECAAGDGLVYVIPVSGVIDPVLADFVDEALDRAERAGAAYAVLEIDTGGGRLDAALAIRDRLLDASVPTVCFVKPRAWSAGALITIAAEKIAMSPSASVGAAEPRPADEKTVAAVRAEFESTAEARGRDPEVAAAMVDKGLEVEGVIEKGQILALTVEEARQAGYVDVVARSRAELLEQLGAGGATVVEPSMTRAESLARFLVHPSVAPALLTIGFLGLVIELLTPGIGLAALVGLGSFGLYFGSRVIAGFAGWEVVALFLVGLVLLGVEALAPGFGVFGISGMGAVLVSIYLASESALAAARSLSISIVLTVGISAVAFRYFARRGHLSRLFLRTTLSTRDGYVAPRERVDLLGAEGRAITPLRPAGAAEIDGERVDVVSEGGFIQAGAGVTVTKVEGGRVVVREKRESPGEGGDVVEPRRHDT